MRTCQLLAVLLGLFFAATLHAQETVAGEKSQLGTLSGRFIYDGDRRKSETSPLEALQKDTPLKRDNDGRVSGVELAYLNYLRAGIRPRTVDESLLVGKEGGLANVFVFATSPDVQLPIADSQLAKRHSLEIKNGQFSPRVLAVTVGSTLEIKNSDPLDSNFHLMAVRNRAVNYLLLPSSTRRLVLSKPEKVPIQFKSNYLGWTTGLLLVHSNPHFAVSAPDGTFSIPNLPPGKWEFCAWHEKVGYLKNWPKGRFQFEIEPDKNDLGDVKLTAEMFRSSPK